MDRRQVCPEMIMAVKTGRWSRVFKVWICDSPLLHGKGFSLTEVPLFPIFKFNCISQRWVAAGEKKALCFQLRG